MQISANLNEIRCMLLTLVISLLMWYCYDEFMHMCLLLTIFCLLDLKQSKLIGSVSYTGSFSGYDEYVPMVDKAVDAVWNRQAPFKKPNASGGKSQVEFVLDIPLSIGSTSPNWLYTCMFGVEF